MTENDSAISGNEKRYTLSEVGCYRTSLIVDDGRKMGNTEVVDVLNNLHEENEQYKSIFFELVETALTDKNCRELYCKGLLDIFDKANSLNQAREMIKEHLK